MVTYTDESSDADTSPQEISALRAVVSSSCLGSYDVTKKLLQSGARTELIHSFIRRQRRAHGRLASLIIWVIAIEMNRADIVKLLVASTVVICMTG